MNSKPNSNTDATPAGYFVHPQGLHTRIPVVVRSVRFVNDAPNGKVVEVTATVGEVEANTETITFHMTLDEAVASDIIGKER